MVVNNDQDVARADALIQLRKAVELGVGEDVKAPLAAALDLTNPDWRERGEFIERIKQVGPMQAAKGLLRTHGV